jgi:urease accessory protein
MGETVNDGFFSDLWTVRRGGSLLYADAMRIAEPFGQTTACSTTLGGHAAMASLLHVGRDIAAKRDALRVGFAQSEGVLAGAGVVGDVLTARIVAPSGNTLRRLLMVALGSLRDRRPLPRNWFC